VLVGDEFVVVSDLVLRWACWWRRWFADLIFTFVYFGGGEELRWCWRCSVLASPGSGFGGDCGGWWWWGYGWCRVISFLWL
jgi:hypothetical protein